MATPKKYSHDRVILLLLSTDIFIGIAAAMAMALRISTKQATSYIVQYRSNLGLNAFKSGNVTNLVSFVIFMLLLVVGAVVLSRQAYPVRRHVSLAILAFTLVALLFAVVVGNALLGLR